MKKFNFVCFAAFFTAFLFTLASCLPAAAQCDTFFNADAANQVSHTYPYPFYPTGVAFTDIDNDGDLDCYLLNEGTSFIPLENKGNAKHPLFDASTLNAPDLGSMNGFEYYYTQDFEFADVDGDGDKDFFLSQVLNFTHGTSTSAHDTIFRYFENTGTSTSPVFTENNAANPLSPELLDSIGSGVFSFYDIDKDGDLDFTYYLANYGYEIYLNEGSKTAPRLLYYATVYSAPHGKPLYWDWNHDGLPDLFTGTNLYLNTGTLAAPAFTLAPFPPVFNNGVPYAITDLNSDQSPEAYTFEGNLSTPAPVPVIDTIVQKRGSNSYVKYYSDQLSPDYIYSWTYNGKPVAVNYHKPFIYAEKQGAYSLEITTVCGTGVSLPHFTYNRYQAPPLFAAASRQTVASLPAPATFSASVYPNPFSQSISIRIPPGKGSSAKSTVMIADAAGRVLSVQTTTAGSTLTTGSALPKGIYFVTIMQNKQVVFRTTVLKQ